MALPYKSWENTPLDPRPPPRGSAAEKLPPPVTRPFTRIFDEAVLRHPRHAELALLGIVAGAVYLWYTKDTDEKERKGRGPMMRERLGSTGSTQPCGSR